MVKKILTIAGSDSSGGAGIQADIKTISALGCYAMSVICSVTAQNTRGVDAIHDMPPDIVAAQIDSVFSDIEVDAVKIGMVSNEDNISVIAERLLRYKPNIIVLDPVMVSTSGHNLLKSAAQITLIEKLIPLASLVTPNLPEAEALSGMDIRSEDDIEKSLYKIQSLGCENVLIKGGHGGGEPIDTLLTGDDIYKFSSKRINTNNTHGTGCTLSSAIAACLAKTHNLRLAVAQAKDYLTYALENSYTVGHGHGPVNHFWINKKN